MRNLIKGLMCAVLLLTSAKAFAESRWGVEVGYVHANIHVVAYDSYAGKLSTNIGGNGFMIGGNYRYDLKSVKGLSIMPGINYTFFANNPEIFIYVAGNELANIRWQEHHLNIPIHIRYQFRLSDKYGLAVFTGPDFRIGLANAVYGQSKGSNYKVHTDYYSGRSVVKSPYDKEVVYNDAIYKRFNPSWGLGLALNISDTWEFKISYDFGMVNRLKVFAPGADDSHRQDYLQITISKLF